MSFRIPLFLLFFSLHPGSAFSQTVDNKYYEQLAKISRRYVEISEKEMWNPLTIDKPLLKLNDTSAALPEIKKRLNILGDLRRVRKPELFDDKLDKAVKQFQYRHGLEEDGIIGPAFLKAINVPVQERISQIGANMSRVSLDTLRLSGRRIIANIPEYKLHIFEEDREVLSMDIVVGKISNPTIVFSDSLESIVFSPYWYIPSSIVRNEILPAIKRNKNYLQKNNMEITGNVNGLPTIRQKPGPGNSLGNVKFLFPNEHNIYFHDTPAKTLFEKRNRAFSHGCIRLKEPMKLAAYLLRDQPAWTEANISQAMNSGRERWVNLHEKIPVSILYYTVWVDSSGLVNFRDDIYGHDEPH